jgi:hypothetical protein
MEWQFNEQNSWNGEFIKCQSMKWHVKTISCWWNKFMNLIADKNDKMNACLFDKNGKVMKQQADGLEN